MTKRTHIKTVNTICIPNVLIQLEPEQFLMKDTYLILVNIHAKYGRTGHHTYVLTIIADYDLSLY